VSWVSLRCSVFVGRRRYSTCWQSYPANLAMASLSAAGFLERAVVQIDHATAETPLVVVPRHCHWPSVP
jgi:hypothetical protein